MSPEARASVSVTSPRHQAVSVRSGARTWSSTGNPTFAEQRDTSLPPEEEVPLLPAPRFNPGLNPGDQG